MREDLIEKLRSVNWEVTDDGDRMPYDPTQKCVFVDMRPDEFEALLRETAAALEAAREDAERMKRDIADLYKVMPMLPITAETMEAATDWFERYCIEFYREINAALDAAIDQARGKGNGND